MSLARYALMRAALVVPLLAAASLLSFVLIQMSPGDPAEVALRLNDITPTPDVLAETRAQLGLDDPFWQRYLTWLWAVLQGDLGTSFVTGRPVLEDMAQALPATLALALCAFALLLVTALPAALLAAFRAGRWPDVLVRGLAFLGSALPPFWAGLLLIWLFAVHWNLLPMGGMEEPASVFLPACTLALPYVATYVRLLRAGLLQVREEHFVLYARALGRSRTGLLCSMLRNALQPTLAGLGMSLPRMMAGSFVVECLFAWPGLGRLCVTAIFSRDFPVIQACVLFLAVLFILCNLAADLLAALLDPRILKSSGNERRMA